MGYKQSQNYVKVCGLLNENKLERRTYLKNGKNIEAIGGQIKVLVEQNDTELEIPVFCWANRYTNSGAENPSYKSLCTVINEYKSVAMEGRDNADKILVSGASVNMNNWYSPQGRLISTPRINASFVSRVAKETKSEATFDLEFAVKDVRRRVDNDGVEVEPAVLDVDAIIFNWTPDNAEAPNVEVLPLVVKLPEAIDTIEQYWTKGDTFKANGDLNFNTSTQQIVEQRGFGKPVTKERTVSIHDLEVTGGEIVAADPDYAFSIEDIKAGLAAREVRLEQLKTNKKQNTSTPGTKASTFDDLGF